MKRNNLSELDAICPKCNTKRKRINLKDIPNEEAQKVFKQMGHEFKLFNYCEKCGEISVSDDWEAF
jgi:uncharacterized protein with PIN domain